MLHGCNSASLVFGAAPASAAEYWHSCESAHAYYPYVTRAPIGGDPFYRRARRLDRGNRGSRQRRDLSIVAKAGAASPAPSHESTAGHSSLGGGDHLSGRQKLSHHRRNDREILRRAHQEHDRHRGGQCAETKTEWSKLQETVDSAATFSYRIPGKNYVFSQISGRPRKNSLNVLCVSGYDFLAS